MNASSTMEGRALASTAAVTFNGTSGRLPNNGPLTIVSAHGTGLLPAGVYTNMYGMTLTNYVTGVETVGSTQYVATGWSMSGNNPTSGSGTNMVMVQTNTATLTWQWATNYALNATSDPNGSLLGSTNGWYLAGSSVTVTAAPSGGFIFAGWTGDVTGPTNNAVQTMTMSQARTAMANFAVAAGPTQTLTIVSEHGVGLPIAGIYFTGNGDTLTNGITDVETIGGTQYVAAGWALAGNVDTNGQVSGIDTNLIMVQTNSAVLTWLWTTNYALNASSDTNGTLTGSTNGWYLAGSSVTVTSAPNPNYLFAGWTGDVPGPTNNAVQTLTMDQARTALAHFVPGPAVPVSLTIISEHGTGLPPVGVYTNGGTIALTNSITGTETIGGTQYVATGWSMTGNDPATGIDTNMVMVQTNNAVLTWLWSTNYWLAVGTSGSGSVTPTSSWFAAGSIALLTATPTLVGSAVSWSGDTNGCVPVGATLAAPMTQARAVTALFANGAGPAISGKVTKFGTSAGVPGVLLTLTGGGLATTDASGNYTCYVPVGWSGFATPSYTNGGTFLPVTMSYSNVTVTKTKQNYVWTPTPVNPEIEGKVTAKSCPQRGIAGIVLTFSGLGTTTTTVCGAYCMTVPNNWSGTVTPSDPNGGGGFSPASRTFRKVVQEVTFVSGHGDFTWIPPPVISGKVTHSKVGVAGVVLTFSGVGSATTDVSGAYSLTVPYNWTGTETPSYTAGTFAPVYKAFSKVTANRVQNFTCTVPTALAVPRPAVVTAVAVAPVELLRTSGSVLWSGADVDPAKQAPELLLIAVNDGVSTVTLPVAVAAPGDLSATVEIGAALLGVVEPAGEYAVVIRNNGGAVTSDTLLPGATTLTGTVTFVPVGDTLVLTWDLTLLRP